MKIGTNRKKPTSIATDFKVFAFSQNKRFRFHLKNYAPENSEKNCRNAQTISA